MNLSIYSDEQLAVRFREEQDVKLFTELVNRHQQSIFKRCYHYVKDQEDARDISQEVLLRLMTRIHTYREETEGKKHTFLAWLNTIIHNRCMDHLKQNKKALHRDISSHIVDTLEAEIDIEEVAKPTLEILEELMEKISGEDKLILILKYKEGWSIQEIHLALSLSESAVKMRLSRSKEKLHGLLEKYRSNA